MYKTFELEVAGLKLMMHQSLDNKRTTYVVTNEFNDRMLGGGARDESGDPLVTEILGYRKVITALMGALGRAYKQEKLGV